MDKAAFKTAMNAVEGVSAALNVDALADAIDAIVDGCLTNPGSKAADKDLNTGKFWTAVVAGVAAAE